MKNYKKIYDRFFWILKNKFSIEHCDDFLLICYKNIKCKIDDNKVNYTRSVAIKGFGNINISKSFYYGMDNVIFSYKDEYFGISFSYDKTKIFNFVNMFLMIKDKYISISEDGMLEKPFVNLPENIFNWSEEDLFYFNLKYC